MNDAEWEGWRETWTRATGRLPDIRARALAQASRHRRANGVLLALMLGGGLADAWAAIAHGADPTTCWGLILWGAVVALGFAWIQRGTRLRKTAAPREALRYLEQQVRIERQGAQLFRWAYAAGIVCVGIYFRNLFGDEWQVKLVARLVLGAVFVVTFSAPWWMRRFTDRQQREVQLWRRWMDEQQL